MTGYHDDRTERNYGPDVGYRSNRDVREAARGRGPAPAGNRRDKDPACRVYVHNLDFGTSWQDLKDHMRGAGGQVEYVKIIQDYDGRSKGFGVCEFTNSRDAKDAIQQLDESVLQGRKIGLRPDRDIAGGDDRSSRRDSDYRGRRDDSYRSTRDDSYRSRRDDDRGSRRDRSPRRDSHRDDRRDDYRDDRGDRSHRQSRSAKTAEELDAEMDVYKEEKHAAAEKQ